MQLFLYFSKPKINDFMINLAVFVSGRGSNLRALYDKFIADESYPKIKFVIGNKSNCPALDFAREKGIKTFIVSTTSSEKSVSYKELAKTLNNNNIHLVVLAGFLKKIPDDFIDEFNGKIINIHPALLPRYGGKGMYGMNVHKEVFENGDKFSGATVHYVDKIYDHGKIIAQQKVRIDDAASPEEIAGKVLEIEHLLLPETVLNIAAQIVSEKGLI